MSIRQEVSEILGYTVLPGEWDKAFDSLNKDGRIQHKHLVDIVKLLLENEEARETKKDRNI